MKSARPLYQITCVTLLVLSWPPAHARDAHPEITYRLWWSGRMKWSWFYSVNTVNGFTATASQKDEFYITVCNLVQLFKTFSKICVFRSSTNARLENYEGLLQWLRDNLYSLMPLPASFPSCPPPADLNDILIHKLVYYSEWCCIMAMHLVV